MHYTKCLGNVEHLGEIRNVYKLEQKH